jgi:drug/metabolite transporter (DMT)-like permease
MTIHGKQYGLPVSSASAGGIVLIVAGTVLIATMDAIVKHASETYSILQITWLRFLVQIPILLVLVPPARMPALLKSTRPGLQALRAGLIVVMSLAFFTAIHLIPLADAYAISFLAPFLITALSVPVLGETVGWRRWTAVIAGGVGVVLVIRPGIGVVEWGALMALLMAVCSAVFHLTTPILGRTEDPVTTLYYGSILGSAVLLVALPFVWVAPDALDWSLLVAIGILGTLGHVFLMRAFQRLPASTLSPFLYLYLLWATGYGIIFFDEVPDVWAVAGGTLIVGAGFYMFRRERLHRLEGIRPLGSK